MELQTFQATVDLGGRIALEIDEIARVNNISKAAVIKIAIFDCVMGYTNYKSS